MSKTDLERATFSAAADFSTTATIWSYLYKQDAAHDGKSALYLARGHTKYLRDRW